MVYVNETYTYPNYYTTVTIGTPTRRRLKVCVRTVRTERGRYHLGSKGAYVGSEGHQPKAS